MEDTQKQKNNVAFEAQQPKKENALTPEQLKQSLDAAILDNRKLVARLQEAEAYIANMNTQNLFTYVTFLFKVMEHPELYSPEFIDDCTGDIQNILTRLHNITAILDDGKGTEGSSQAE